MTKKRIIIGILIALLLIAGIAVNIIAIKQRKEIEVETDNSTNVVEKVEKTPTNSTKDNKQNENIIEEDELELRGENYTIAEVKDKDGNKTSLDREENKPMILLFWNGTEENIEEVEILQSYYSKYNKKVSFALITVDNEDVEAVEKIIDDKNIEIKNVYDTVNKSASTKNNVKEIPTLIAIDKKGEIINKLSTNLNEDVIEANLDVISENF